MAYRLERQPYVIVCGSLWVRCIINFERSSLLQGELETCPDHLIVNAPTADLSSELEAQRLMAAQLSRLVRHPVFRKIGTNQCIDILNKVMGPYTLPASRFGDCAALHESGYQRVDIGLPIAEVARMREFFASRRGHPDDEGRYYHPATDLAVAPHAIEIATSDDMLALAGSYLGTRATLASLTSWWTMIPERLLDDQVFHRDNPDIRFCKLFIYLTDVEPEDGPHEFVLSSHNWDHIRLRLKEAGVTDPRELQRATETFFTSLAPDVTPLVLNVLQKDIHTITGPAGTAFVEDTFAVHRAKPPAPGRSRLLYQALYTVNLDYGSYEPMTQFRSIDSWKSRLPQTEMARYAVRHWL